MRRIALLDGATGVALELKASAQAQLARDRLMATVRASPASSVRLPTRRATELIWWTTSIIDKTQFSF